MAALPEETVTRSPRASDIYTVVITVAIISSLPNKNLGSLARLEAPGPPPHLQAPQEAAGQSRLPVAPLPAPPPPDCARDTMSHFCPQRPDQCSPWTS